MDNGGSWDRGDPEGHHFTAFICSFAKQGASVGDLGGRQSYEGRVESTKLYAAVGWVPPQISVEQVPRSHKEPHSESWDEGIESIIYPYWPWVKTSPYKPY